MSSDPKNIAEAGLNPLYVSWYAGPVRDDQGPRRRLSIVPRDITNPRDGLSLSMAEVQNLMAYVEYSPDSEPFRSYVSILNRASLLLRIAALWRGDWRGDGAFDGKDGSRWIHLAMGTREDLATLDQLLTTAEKAYE
jgi:hypothetical protein